MVVWVGKPQACRVGPWAGDQGKVDVPAQGLSGRDSLPFMRATLSLPKAFICLCEPPFPSYGG